MLGRTWRKAACSSASTHAMLGFAETVFGEPFPPDCVITESRVLLDTWLATPSQDTAGLDAVSLTTTTAAEIVAAVRALGGAPVAAQVCATVLNRLWVDDSGEPATGRPLASLAKAHPTVRSLIEQTRAARNLNDVEAELFAGEDVNLAGDPVQPAPIQSGAARNAFFGFHRAILTIAVEARCSDSTQYSSTTFSSRSALCRAKAWKVSRRSAKSRLDFSTA